MRSVRSIKKGEELFLDYAYDLDDYDVPRWYKALHKKRYGGK